jgi:UDP-N-acetylglucosamine 2-epimerase (non-hydrolysing)
MIVRTAQSLIDNQAHYKLISEAYNPYGDGKASQRIIEFIKSRYHDKC